VQPIVIVQDDEKLPICYLNRSVNGDMLTAVGLAVVTNREVSGGMVLMHHFWRVIL
jgi:hypothetical protein